MSEPGLGGGEGPVEESTAHSTAALVGATVVALVIANSPWGHALESFWHHHLAFDLNTHEFVNDALMAVFFLSVGVELKREFVDGELSDLRIAMVPVAAAIGGMVVPAVLYLLLNGGTGEAHGWGIPIATDIAFALGVLALVARDVPPTVRVFLLTLAVVDDLGAIAVIAFVYSGSIDWLWLAGALTAVAFAWTLHRRGRSATWLHMLLFILAWVCTFRSGVHATAAGVMVGMVAPVAAGHGWEQALDKPIRWGVLPLFAFANAGVVLSSDVFDSTATRSVALGVVLGLVVGKPLGIVGAAWIAVRTTRLTLPTGVTWRHVAGVGALGGMGFTVSLLVVDLALPGGSAAGSAARLAVVGSTVLAAAAGAAVLRSRVGRGSE